MFFKRFTNPIYGISEVTNYFFGFLELYIKLREYRFIGQDKKRPPEVRRYLTEESYENLKALNRQILLVHLVHGTWLTLVQIIFSDELAHISLWNLSVRLSKNSTNEMYVSCIFIFLVTCKDFFLELPVNIYIYHNKGFKLHETLQGLSFDFCLKQFAQYALLTSFIYISKLVPNISKMSLIASSIAFILSLAYAREAVIISSLIDGTTKRLEDKVLLKELRPYLKKMSFPEENLYVLQMESADHVPNAFTTGHSFLNNQKIVVSNNFIGKNKHLNDCCTVKETIAIILHELGHVFYNHTTKSFFVELLITSSTCIAFVLLYQDIVFESFGFHTRPIVIGMLIRMDLLLGYNMVCAFAYMLFKRHCEYQADLFSFAFSKLHLRNALIKIHLIKATLPEHDPWYSAWNNGHPSLMERILR
ncbi:hypothetical protein M8J76_007435 [Diaphorina citri]|nr:hypothetical protein M8J76_007435 [Diaphorina citri]